MYSINGLNSTEHMSLENWEFCVKYYDIIELLGGDFVDIISQQANAHLIDSGVLLFEMGRVVRIN